MKSLEKEIIRISYGTAITLGLLQAKQDIAPTTAYLLWDEGCSGACSFCPRANGNNKAQKLSRIIWPEFDLLAVLDELQKKPQPFKRVCLQTGFNKEKEATLKQITSTLIAANLVTSVTLSPSQTELATELLSSGADHIGIGLDGATAETYHKHKKKNWQHDWPALLRLIARHPEKIEVHLIFGLGDNETDFCQTIASLVDAGGKISLFALTPVNGGSAPEIPAYRRIQLFRYLYEKKLISLNNCSFNQGLLTKIENLEQLISQHDNLKDCFRTSGCNDCNRPYYNERPGQEFYNFPRPLSKAEFAKSLKQTGLHF
jgi:biotin synthase